jgi:hypothetical protein
MRRIIGLAAIATVVAGAAAIWSNVVLIRPQAAVIKVLAAQTAHPISPFEIMVLRADDLPLEKWGGTPF